MSVTPAAPATRAVGVADVEAYGGLAFRQAATFNAAKARDLLLGHQLRRCKHFRMLAEIEQHRRWRPSFLPQIFHRLSSAVIELQPLEARGF
jgi:hypothetical protein